MAGAEPPGNAGGSELTPLTVVGLGGGRPDGGRCTDDMRPLDVRKISLAGLQMPARWPLQGPGVRRSPLTQAAIARMIKSAQSAPAGQHRNARRLIAGCAIFASSRPKTMPPRMLPTANKTIGQYQLT